MSGRPCPRGFTLIEVLVVVAIIASLFAVLLPSLRHAREAARQVVCLSNMRQLAMGWHMYADAYNDISVPNRPPRMAPLPDGTENPANYYHVGNGMKWLPTWLAFMGRFVGLYAFNHPRIDTGRQDYDGEVYICPTVPEWVDERNHAYGYNFQFLGNTRNNSLGRPTHFPVKRSWLTHPSSTVLCADSMGTAAGFPAAERTPYENDGTTRTAVGNHAWTLDPPRLTTVSSRGTQNQGRGGVDPRHRNRANTLFLDGHARPRTAEALGYRILEDGRFADVDDHALLDGPPANHHFSGRGQDLDPPVQHF